MTGTDVPARRATIDDVARLAGVSRAAVSKVIRGAYGVSSSMQERVEAAVDELDYRPSVAARGMRGATFTLGMELPNTSNQFFNQILTGATSVLETEPYQLIVAPADPFHQEGYRAIEALADRQVDGVVTVSALVEPRWLEEVSGRLPVVMLGRHDASKGYDTVVGDDVAGARLIMDHLFGLGHREIVHLTHEDFITQRGSGTPHSLRLQTYEESMEQAGLGSAIRIVRQDSELEGEAGAYNAALALLSEPDRPTAIFAGHDELAIGVLRAVAELGLTAEDVSVVGYDNTLLARHPLLSLTSIDQEGERMGAAAVSLLLERIAGRTEPVHEVVAPRLIPRNSTRAPRVRVTG
jgi:LacI family transcriptional regulator